ncbi:ABC transporter permease, partial [Candidatus Hodarchaeum mangrovi]
MKKQQVGLVIGLAKKNASRSKYRSFLLIFGVILTIALETGIVISVDTLYDDFIFNNRNQNFTDISVFPKKWLDISPLQSIAETIRYIKGVRKASPVYSIVANKFLPEEIPDTNILIYGIDPETHPDISILNVTKGENTIVSNKIVVSQNLLQQSGFQVGESFDIPESELNLKSRTLTIIGSIGDPTFFGNNIGYLFILININTLLDLIQENDKPNLLRAKIDVSVDNLLDIKEVNERIKDKLSIDFYVWNEKDISDIEAEGIRIYQIAMNLVILASFLVEFLFITNILAIVIKDRSKEFGIFRAVGGSNSQLIVMITSEILIYSIIGSIIGLIIGLGLATVLVGLMQSFYSSLNLKTLSLNPLSLLATLSSGIIVTIISGLYPIFIALTQPVVQNIHSNMRNKRSSIRFLSKWKYTIISGTLIILAGFILQFFVGPTRFLDFKILSIQFFVLLFIFIGTVFVEIGFLIFLPKIATKLLTPFVGIIIQTISIRNIAREFQKSLFTIMTAALALTFIIVVGIVSSAIISGVPVFIQDQWGRIDLVAEARDNQLPDINFTQILEQNESILRSSFIQRERTEIQGVYSYVYGVDPSRYSYFAEDVIESVAGYSAFKDIYPNQTKGSIAVDTTYGLVSELLFQKLYSSIGSNISVKIADNSTLLVTIAAVIKSNVFLGNGEYLYISSNRFNECFNSTLAKYFLCDVEGDISRVRTLFELNYPQFKEVLAIDFFAKAIERSLLFQSVIFQILFLESFILAAIAQF